MNLKAKTILFYLIKKIKKLICITIVRNNEENHFLCFYSHSKNKHNFELTFYSVLKILQSNNLSIM